VLREKVRRTFQYGRAVSGAHLQGTVTNGVSFECIVLSNTLPRKKKSKGSVIKKSSVIQGGIVTKEGAIEKGL